MGKILDVEVEVPLPQPSESVHRVKCPELNPMLKIGAEYVLKTQAYFVYYSGNQKWTQVLPINPRRWRLQIYLGDTQYVTGNDIVIWPGQPPSPTLAAQIGRTQFNDDVQLNFRDAPVQVTNEWWLWYNAFNDPTPDPTGFLLILEETFNR